MADINPKIEEVLSDLDDRLDKLVERSSRPNLASLYRRGKEAGLINSVPGYEQGSGPVSTP